MRPIALALLFSLFVPLAGAQDLATLERLREQAWRGDAEAQLEMGILYEFGFRMPNNKAPALAWYRLAAEHGNAKAAARRDALRAGMTPPELEEAQRLYEQWRAKMPVAAGSPAPVP
jgi:TPR repeat protein